METAVTLNVHDKDQRKFIAHCRRHIAWYEDVLEDAREAADKARNECKNEIKRDNAATRAGNLVLLDALKSCGRQVWRDTTQ